MKLWLELTERAKSKNITNSSEPIIRERNGDATEGKLGVERDELGLQLIRTQDKCGLLFRTQLLNSTFASSTLSSSVEIFGNCWLWDILGSTSNIIRIDTVTYKRRYSKLDVDWCFRCWLSTRNTLCYGRTFFGLRGSLSSSRLSVKRSPLNDTILLSR